MKNEAIRFSDFHNRNHRYGCIGYKTPEQAVEPLEKRFKLSAEWDMNAKILIEEGALIFIRFIRSKCKLRIPDSVFSADLERLRLTRMISLVSVRPKNEMRQKNCR